MTTLDTIFTDAIAEMKREMLAQHRTQQRRPPGTDADHGSSCGMTQPSSFNPSLYVLAPTSVGASIECVTHRLMLLPVIRALDAGRSLQGGPAPFTPSLPVKGSRPVAVSTESVSDPSARALCAGSVTSVTVPDAMALADVQRIASDLEARLASGDVRYADLAVDETQDVREAATRTIKVIDAALADGVITPEEMAHIRNEVRSIQREADEAYVVVELTNAVELDVMSRLAGRRSGRAAKRTAEAFQLADQIGYSLVQA